MKRHSHASGNPVKKKTLNARFHEHDKKESVIPLNVGINSTLVIPALAGFQIKCFSYVSKSPNT